MQWLWYWTCHLRDRGSWFAAVFTAWTLTAGALIVCHMAQNSMLLKSAQNVSQYQWWVMYGQQQWECDCGQVVNMYVLPGFAEVTRVCSNVAERNFNVNCCKSWNLWMKELLLLYWVCTLLLVKVCRVLTLRLSLLLAFAVLWNAPSNITAASWSPVLWLAVMYPYVYIRTFRVQ